MTTQSEFYQQHAQHAVDGMLPDHLTAQMLALPEGDTPVAGPAVGSDDSPIVEGQGTATPAPAPSPAPAAAPTPAPQADPANAVILARDGVHTIPYERLDEARRLAQEANTRAEEASRQAAALAEENARLKAGAQAPSPAPAPSATPAPQPDAEGGLFGDYSDAQIQAGVEKLIAARTATLHAEVSRLQEQLTPVQQQATLNANEAHWREIYGAHPDMDHLVESRELEAWIGKQPTFAQAGYRNVLDQGTASEVVELFNAYKAANGIPLAGSTQPPAAPAPAPAANAAAAAAAAIAAAKHVPPSSLSEIPAGTSAHHDEAAAMLEMTPQALMQKFEGKSPAEINAAINRIL